MTFLQFLGYFMVSMFIYRHVMDGISTLIQKYLMWKLDRDIKSGKIQVMTEDQLINLMSDEEKKIWQ